MMSRRQIWKCWAYEEGRICGRPAVAICKQRGITVCEKHILPDPEPLSDKDFGPQKARELLELPKPKKSFKAFVLEALEDLED